MIREAISLVVEKTDLSEEQAAAVMDEIMSGGATPAQFAAFVTALRLKGETVDEIAGMARVMRAKSERVECQGAVLDTCGTGGDASGTFNVSTASAFVAAAAGARVAKHGNRAMSSQCGSADVLEALGANIELSPEEAASCLEKTGFCFMFAPRFHPAMRFAAAPRREIGIRTVFNILGPVCNPAGASRQVLGVADEELGDKMARALSRLGCEHAIVVHGEGRLDEFSPVGRSYVWSVKNGDVTSFQTSPSDAGLPAHSLSAVAGGTAAENAESLRSVLAGKQGALRDFTLLNTAAALLAFDLVADLKMGVEKAAAAIDSGGALEKLETFIEVSNATGL